jgi:GTP-binding protein Era
MEQQDNSSKEFPKYHAGFVAVMGKPNVGKSTLMNALLGQKIAAVSPRPQTTRRSQLGILTDEDAQLIFVDTPGIHKPRYKLGEIMNEDAGQALGDSDVILFVVDASEAPTEEDELLAGQLRKLKRKAAVLLVLNKKDLLDPEQLETRRAEFLALAPQAEPVAISATGGTNIDGLLEEIKRRLPEHDPFYPEEQITDLYEKEIAADLIREAALIDLRDEIPHGITVRIDEFTERSEGNAFIAATIFVERESHKGIVIGQGGLMLKKIGSDARREIEEMSGRKIFLQLKVKVKKNWRNDEDALRVLGYKRSGKGERR